MIGPENLGIGRGAAWATVLGNHITCGAEKAPQVRFFLFERSDYL
jgi:hypothetical protein